MTALVLAWATLLATPTSPAPRPPTGYAIADSIELTAERDAAAGRIELLQDVRLTPAVRRLWWGLDATSCSAPTDPALADLCRSIGDRPLLPAVVRLVTPAGAVVDQRAFERELAGLAQRFVYGTRRRTFLVTVDYGVGFGSYAGATTLLVEPTGARLVWLRAVGASTSKVEEIRLPKTLKSGWKTIPRRDLRGLDLLAVRCAPDFERLPENFVVRYERYTFTGNHWVRLERREPGLWENEGPFPAREKFP